MFDWRIGEEDSKRDLGRGKGERGHGRGYLDEVQTRDQVHDVGSMWLKILNIFVFQ